MLTPIIKVTNKNETISFYNMTDYENWLEINGKKGNWKIKYYKGLGTSTDEEAKDYFRNMKKITYKYNEFSDENIDLAFNKKRADDRKTWLLNYDKNNVLDYNKLIINYDTFINKEFIHYSNRDLERSINHICDGLKESTRKILYACIKRKLYTNEIKVAQLAGNVSEVTAYHHGESSLQSAIIGMAQIYVGTNNINILAPNGQFGSRIQGGNDSSSPRYIYTMLSSLTKLIFREEDSCILNYLEEDGLIIEPDYYIPIIPMILVNGGIGIGTGFSTNIPQYNPSDIINTCIMICNVLNENNIKINNSNELYNAYDIINKISIKEFIPYYLGFTGTITKSDKEQYESRGVYNWLDDTTLVITELPIGTWTENYKEFLESLILNNNQFNLKSFESHYTAKNIKFILHFNPGSRTIHNNIEKFENIFKLVSTKNLSINNMHLYSSNGAIKKYKNSVDILKEWCKIRLEKYIDRKNILVKNLEKDYNIMSSKIKFILDVINGNIKIMNIKLEIIANRLVELNYPKIYKDSDDEIDNNNTLIKGYNYLIKMPISQLTMDRKIILEKEVEELKNKLDKLKKTPIQNIWIDELNELNDKWIEHKNNIETNLLNDKNNIIIKSTKNKTKK